MKSQAKTFLPILIGVLIGASIFGVRSIAKRFAKPDPFPQQRQSAKYIPEITSCVKKVSVARTELVNGDTSEAAVLIGIENKSQIGIVAIIVESVGEKETFETTLRGSFETDPPATVINPGGVGTLQIAMANVFAGAPLRISGAVYADGTEEGCERGLKTLRQVKEHEKSKRKDQSK